MSFNKALTLYELAVGDSVSSVIATMLKEQGLIESVENDQKLLRQASPDLRAV
ncbi:hypothetical protein KW882_01530 [Vibrio parahaemolyticus]